MKTFVATKDLKSANLNFNRSYIQRKITNLELKGFKISQHVIDLYHLPFFLPSPDNEVYSLGKLGSNLFPKFPTCPVSTHTPNRPRRSYVRRKILAKKLLTIFLSRKRPLVSLFDTGTSNYEISARLQWKELRSMCT